MIPSCPTKWESKLSEYQIFTVLFASASANHSPQMPKSNTRVTPLQARMRCHLYTLVNFSFRYLCPSTRPFSPGLNNILAPATLSDPERRIYQAWAVPRPEPWGAIWGRNPAIVPGLTDIVEESLTAEFPFSTVVVEVSEFLEISNWFGLGKKLEGTTGCLIHSIFVTNYFVLVSKFFKMKCLWLGGPALPSFGICRNWC